jgi:hypothetical protein
VYRHDQEGLAEDSQTICDSDYYEELVTRSSPRL